MNSAFIITYLFIVGAYYVQRRLGLFYGVSSLAIELPVAVITSLIVGLRPLDAGFDTQTYVLYFKSIEAESWDSVLFSLNSLYAYNFELDYLYKFWNLVFAKIGIEAGLFLYITSFTSIYLFLRATKVLFKEKYLLVFLVLFSTPGFVMFFGNAIRQGLALSFFIWSIYCHLEKKKQKLILFVLITFLFHFNTGLVLVVCLLLSQMLMSVVKNNAIIIILTAVFSQLLSPYLLDYLYQIFSIPQFLTEGNATYFGHYSFIIYIVIFIFYSSRSRFLSENDWQMITYYTALVIVASLVWNRPSIYGRILYLQFPFLCYLFVDSERFVKEKFIRFIFIFLMFFVGIYFFMSESTQRTLS